jgi:uncharacterized protein
MKKVMPLIGALLACTVFAADYQVGARLAPTGPDETGQQFQEVSWDDLLPEDWNPMEVLAGLDLDELDDADPRAEEAAQKLRAMWDEAPSNPAIGGKAIRIPGFMVPLEYGKEEVTEFLLVPYFGACIHVPPPPANQIIHVTAAQPYQSESYMDAVWVEGVIELAESSTDMGDSGYRMQAQKVEPYEEPY